MASAWIALVPINILSADIMGSIRSTVILIKLLSSSINFNNCLGLSLVDRGQNLSPDPPAIINAANIYHHSCFIDLILIFNLRFFYPGNTIFFNITPSSLDIILSLFFLSLYFFYFYFLSRQNFNTYY